MIAFFFRKHFRTRDGSLEFSLESESRGALLLFKSPKPGVTKPLGGGTLLRTILQMVRGAERLVSLGIFIEGYYLPGRHRECIG